MVDGNLALVYGAKSTWTEGVWQERDRLLHHFSDFSIIPAGRHLWATGVKDRQFLFNCVSGNTPVHTSEGVVPISTLSGRKVGVLSEGGIYRSARFSSYGQQELFEVSLSTGETFFATAEHEWVTHNSGVNYRHKTLALKGKYLPYNQAPSPSVNTDYETGVAHGIVYGDGSESGSSTMIHLFGKKRGLLDWVAPFSRNEAIEHEDRTYVGTLPGHWKSLPKENEGRSYWRGFIAGLIATDGTVTGNSVCIDQSDPEALSVIRNKGTWAGLVFSSLKMTREFSPYTGERAPCYRLRLRSWSIDKDMDFVRVDQYDRFSPKRVNGLHTVRVKSVRATGRVEEVFCCTEEQTHTMTIGSGVLTGQCHVAPWGEKLSDHFEFTFMRLMEGGGVGANYSSRFLEPYGSPRRALKTHIVCDPDHPDYAEMMESGLLSTEFNSDWAGAFDVEDSREGWAGALVDLIDTAMTDDAVEHENRVYDVSRVRKKGARLKTFGGTASGPAPLAKMMHEVAAVLSEAAEYGEAVATLGEILHQGDGSHLSPMDAMDMDHAIASCVVAGGVRRSARMAGVHWQDPFIFDFIESKKDRSKNWTTNISVIIDEDFLDLLQMTEGMAEGMTFEVFQKWVDAQAVHEAAVEGMLTNGEPGYWNYDLSNDGEVNEVVITNPCLTGDTVIATVKGPRTFEELALAGEDVEVYSWDPKTKLPVVRWMRRPHLTRHEAEIVKVTFDSGLTVRCTPDHNFYTFRGEKVQARSLVPGRSIRAFSASFDGSNHERVHGWDSQRNAAAHQYTHRMIWENANGPIPDGMVVAHLDGDATNNVLENLQVMTPYEHASYDYPKRLAAGFDGHCPNHKVVSVEADGYADVYNGMVEDSHTYIILDPNPVAGHMSGVVSANCGEIALPERGACVLGHVNMDRFAPTKMGGPMDGPGLVEAHQLMTRFLIRATYGDMSDAGQKDVMQSERRIGVGHFGVQGFLAKYGIPYSLAPRNKVVRMLLASLKEVVREEARNYSFQLRIPEPVKVTTVAPTGSIAKLPGATEGIHPVLFRYFIQRIRFSATNPDQIAQVEAFRAEGLDVEVDQYDASGDTLIVCFPTEHLLVAQVVAMGFQAELVETASEISLEDMLDFQEMYQTEYADNAVSFTVNMAAEPHQLAGMLANPFGDVLPPTRERVAHVAKVLAKRLYRLKGTTLMIDGSRPQAPYEEITKAQYELATYVVNGDGIDEDCASGACPVR